MRVTSLFRATSRTPLLQAVKTSVATVLSWTVSVLVLPTELPVFAAIGALLVVQPSLSQSLGKAVERSLGVILGVVLATVIQLIFGQSSWVVLLAVVVAILFAWALKLSVGSANQIPISAMLVLSLGGSPAYAVDRILETLIGVAIGFAVNLAIVPPVALEPAETKTRALAFAIAAQLDDLAVALQKEQTRADLDTLMIQARLLRPMQTSAAAAIVTATESLAFNPRRTTVRDRLASTQRLFAAQGPLVTRTIGMSRAFHDHYDADLHDEPTVLAIAEQLVRAAHDLRLLTDAVAPSPEPIAEEPMLTAPIRILEPNAEHWILIGSLLEDLRRIREEITGDAP